MAGSTLSPPPPRARGSWLTRHAAAAAALAFLLPALATLHDVGLTWDEGESYRAGARNLQILAAAVRGEPLPPWPWHELTGYQFAGDSVRAAFAAAANRLLWAPGSYHGFHLFNLLLTAVVVGLTGRLAARETGLAALAPLAALLLALQPKLVAHAASNPKDGLGLLVWLLAVSAASAAARHGRWRDYAALGAAAGMALATHVSALLLAPLAAAWVLVVGNGTLHRRLRGLVFAGALALPTALVLWPWLWPAPLSRGLLLLRHLRTFAVDMRVLYLGELYPPGDLPWHYGLVSLAIATPLPWLLLATVGALRALSPGGAGVARLSRLALLWLVLLLGADLAAPARYDGARHLLAGLPALALLATAGVAALAQQAWPAGRRARLAGAGALVLTLLAAGWQLAAAHPYADAWLNLVARRWLGPEAQRRVELEYWGASYREGARWLLAHAPADALILVPIGAHVPAPYLTGRLELVPHDSHPDTTRPRYLMVITRVAWYTPRVQRTVEQRAPLFTVRRQGSTLLAVYRETPADTH